MSRLIYFNTVLFVLFFSSINAFTQQKKESLYQKREKILKEITLTNKLIESTTKKKGRSLNQVRLINSKIKKREQLIKSYVTEISIIENKVEDRKLSITQLESELKKQKVLYAEFIRYSYKNHDHFSIAFYLLASESLNQFYLRKKYLEQLNDARNEKITLIENLQKRIKYEIIELNSEKEQKNKAIVKIKNEQQKLASEKVGKQRAVNILSEEENKLRTELSNRKRVEAEIATKLEEIIRAEAKKSKYAKVTPEDKLISSDFEKNKGRLPWPTIQGVITEKFGEHYHPVIKNVKTRNNGVDITTLNGEVVRCVFGGEISKIFSIKGVNYTVIVRHGSYYTVYHNVTNLKVNVGDKVKTKQLIGRASNRSNGDNAILQFQIRKGPEVLNPEVWLSK